MNADEQAAFDRAWRHFQLHAEQRIAVFNFFVASSGLLLTGLAYVLAGEQRLWPFGVAAGFMTFLLAIVFWKLDQRSSQLVRVSESEIEAIEAASSQRCGVFSSVALLPTANSINAVRSVWTSGRSFRLLFFAVAMLGLVGGGVSLRSGILAGLERHAVSQNQNDRRGANHRTLVPGPSVAKRAPDRTTVPCD